MHMVGFFSPGFQMEKKLMLILTQKLWGQNKTNDKQMKPLFIFLFIQITFSACVHSGKEKKVEKSAAIDGWQLVWADEFDTDGLPDTAKWNYATYGNMWGWGNNEKQWYTDADPDNAYIRDGILTITAIKEPTEGKDYSSARLTTHGKGDWKYCRVEVRAKMPEGRGTWPAIWMLPSDNTYGKWPLSGEIDIMEHVGFSPDTVFSTVHTGAFNHTIGTQVGKKIGLPTATSEFHVFTTEWDEKEIRSFVDGEHYFTFSNNGEGFEAWPFDQPFHLILNLAIGGGLGGKMGIDETLFPHPFQIDYVRVYKRSE